MQQIIQQARRKAGLTQEQAAKKMFLGLRQYQRLEHGDQELTPEEAVRLSKVLDCPQLTMVYCRKKCAVGRRYCYDVLNNVDLSPTAILTKYRHEALEVEQILEQMSEIFLNKQNHHNCTEAELQKLWNCSLEMLDIEHVIETFKLRLWDFLDVAALVREHNLKCLEKRYVDEKKPELRLAG